MIDSCIILSVLYRLQSIATVISFSLSSCSDFASITITVVVMTVRQESMTDTFLQN